MKKQILCMAISICMAAATLPATTLIAQAQTNGSEVSVGVNEPITRGMFVAKLGETLKIDTTKYKANKFTDIKADLSYAPYVTWASEIGIANGVSDAAFAPDKPITREEMATMLYRYAKSTGGGFTGAWAFRLDLEDAGSISDWAYESICWFYMKEIMKGGEDKVINPKGTVTEAEAVQVITSFLKAV